MWGGRKSPVQLSVKAAGREQFFKSPCHLFPFSGRDFPPDAAGLPVSASRSDENTDTYWLRFSYLEVLPENLAERLAEFFRVS